MNLEQLKAGVRNTRELPLHGGNVRMRVLSEDELLQCRTDALAHAQRTGLDDEGMMLDQVIRQLYLALDDGDGNKLAGTVGDFKKHLSRPDRVYLTGEYLALEKECSPSLSSMTKVEFDETLEAIKKNPDLILKPSNFDMLKRLVRYLESQQIS